MVCCRDQRTGSPFQIRPDHGFALDVCYHPTWYVTCGDLRYEDDLLAE
jgi:hypothetical protein